MNPFLSLLSYSDDEEPEPGCFYNWGGVGDFQKDEDLRVFYELNWRKIEKDERFMRPEASWRRMLFMQPPPWEIDNYYREAGSYMDSKRTSGAYPSDEKNPTRLGKAYANILKSESDKRCLRTRTMLQSSDSYIIALATNIQIKPIDTEEDMIESWKGMF